MIPRGAVIGGHEIIALIAEGGMGAVYKARQGSRELALKVVARSDLDSEALERFQREGRFAAVVSHPHILPVHASGLDGDWLWLSMPLASEGNLADIIEARAPLHHAEVAELLAPIAEALDALHAAGVLHRDLKPQNIVMMEGGRAALADFGIARAAGLDTLTASQEFLGTPAYMSPEQVVGEPLTAQVDLWALGVIAYELLTGRLPFDGPTTELLLRVANGKPEPFSGPARGVVFKALARDPERRYASAQAFVAALRTPQPLRDIARRSGWGLLVGLAAALVILAAWGVLSAGDAGELSRARRIATLSSAWEEEFLAERSLAVAVAVALGVELSRAEVSELDARLAAREAELAELRAQAPEARDIAALGEALSASRRLLSPRSEASAPLAWEAAALGLAPRSRARAWLELYEATKRGREDEVEATLQRLLAPGPTAAVAARVLIERRSAALARAVASGSWKKVEGAYEALARELEPGAEVWSAIAERLKGSLEDPAATARLRSRYDALVRLQALEPRLRSGLPGSVYAALAEDSDGDERWFFEGAARGTHPDGALWPRLTGAQAAAHRVAMQAHLRTFDAAPALNLRLMLASVRLGILSSIGELEASWLSLRVQERADRRVRAAEVDPFGLPEDPHHALAEALLEAWLAPTPTPEQPFDLDVDPIARCGETPGVSRATLLGLCIERELDSLALGRVPLLELSRRIEFARALGYSQPLDLEVWQLRCAFHGGREADLRVLGRRAEVFLDEVSEEVERVTPGRRFAIRRACFPLVLMARYASGPSELGATLLSELEALECGSSAVLRFVRDAPLPVLEAAQGDLRQSRFLADDLRIRRVLKERLSSDE